MKVYHRWNSAGSFGPAALRPVGFYGQVFVQAQRREAWGRASEGRGGSPARAASASELEPQPQRHPRFGESTRRQAAQKPHKAGPMKSGQFVEPDD